jgi:hypothetical protein
MNARTKATFTDDTNASLARTMLATRGFTDSQIDWWVDKAGVHYLDHLPVSVRFGPKADGLIIPYYDLDGNPVVDCGRPFERVRLCFGANGGAVTRRYSQEPGTQIHAYLPPLTGETWREVFADPTREIAITEGEFKAGQATQVGIPTVGLGGVDCLVTKNNGLVPELRGMKLFGRTVFIIFDAPLHKKLQQSIKRAVAHLMSQGAVVKVCNIENTDTYKSCSEQSAKWREDVKAANYNLTALGPAPAFLMKEDGKMGLDDYLLAGGLYQTLRAEAKPIEEAFPGSVGDPSEASNPLLGEIAIVTGYGGVFYLHLTGSEAGLSRNRESMSVVQAPVKVMKAAGKETKFYPAFNDWLENPWRVEIGTILTRPDFPPLSITPDGHWNSWTGLSTVPKRNQTYAGLFNSFVRDFFDSEVEGPEISESHRQKFLQWCAHLFQKPGRRHFTSWTFTSDQEGIGKSALAELIAYIIGIEGRNPNGDGAGAGIAGASTFEGDYVDVWPGKMFMVLNEPSSDNAKMRQRMKNYRTDPFLESNTKYGAKFNIRNEVNFIFTTNEPYAFGISEDARRDWVWEPDKKQSNKEWVRRASEFAALATGRGQKADDFRAAVLWELLHEVSLEGYDPFAHAEGSKAKTAAATASKSRVGSGVQEVLDDILMLFEDPELKAAAWTQEAWQRFSGEINRNVQTTTKGTLKRELEKRGYTVDRPQLGPKNDRFKVWAVIRKGCLWSRFGSDEKQAAVAAGNNSGLGGMTPKIE